MRKHKIWMAMVLSTVLMTSVAGCGNANTTAAASSAAETSAESGSETSEQVVYGKVTSIDGNKVTVTIGTKEGPTFTEGSESEEYDLTNAKVKKESMGQGGPGGNGGSDGQAPSGDSDSADSGSADAEDQTPGGQDPSGDGDRGGAMEMPTEDAELSDISEGDILKLTLSDDGSRVKSLTICATMDGQGGPGGNGGPGQADGGTVDQGSAATTISEDSTVENTTYESSGDDENALRVDGATVTLSGITVNKTGGSSSNVENGDFYGANAGLLATNGATVTIKNASVTTNAQNGNGVFSYGSGTTVNISDSTITTTKDNSGGIQTTGGATTNASNLTVTTAGNSAAAIRSDRGGGTVNVTGGTYTSNGFNSPAVYSTAAITVKDASLTANNSEALVIEGENSIAAENCAITGNMSDTEGTSSDINVHNVMIYQSMSGDAEEGTSELDLTGGSLTAQNGDMFYITNTSCRISLSGVTIKNEDSDANLMTIAGNDASHGWGTAGSNGGNVELTCSGQTLEGNISVDSISTLNMTLGDKSTFSGTINIVDNAEGGTAVDDNAVVTIEAGSTWNLTGDCTITSLSNAGTINYNGYTITLADGTVLGG